MELKKYKDFLKLQEDLESPQTTLGLSKDLQEKLETLLSLLKQYDSMITQEIGWEAENTDLIPGAIESAPDVLEFNDILKTVNIDPLMKYLSDLITSSN